MKKILVVISGLCVLSACQLDPVPLPEFPSGCNDFIIERITEKRATVRLIRLWIPDSNGGASRLRQIWVLNTAVEDPLIMPCNLPEAYQREGQEVVFDANVLSSSRVFSNLDGFIPVSINYIEAYVEDED
jgi:hypothetical protein